MSDNCPTCGSPVRVECSGVTSYFVPLTATQAREHELAARLKCLEASRERVIQEGVEQIKAMPTGSPVRAGMQRFLNLVLEIGSEERY